MGSIQIHASCVSIKSRGVLILGESGFGKSDMALCLIDRGADLVSDDRTDLTKDGESIIAKSPEKINGLIEVRGIGIFRLQAENSVAVSMVVQLEHRNSIERLPVPEFYECMGIKIPQIRLYPFDVSSYIKIEMSLAALHDSSIMVAGAFGKD